MSRKHFDVISIGAEFSGRIASLLLARKGLRVLTLCSLSFQPPTSFVLSPVLEGLAFGLEGIAKCRRPAERFQIITPDIRLDFHGPRPLEKELRRELPGSAEQIFACLELLAEWGGRLEKLLMQPGPPPALGLPGNLNFRRRLLFGGLAGKRFGQKLPSLLARFIDPRAKEVLLSLFAGLSLADPLHLTIAEAALLWHCAKQPTVLDGPALIELLDRLFEQFHGQTRPLAQLASLQSKGKTLQQVVLQDGRQLTAGHFLVDRMPDAPIWSHGLPSGYSTAYYPVQWQLKLECRPPLLLAPRVILAGSPPLLLTFQSSASGGQEARVQAAGSTNMPPLDIALVRRRLETILPFADYQLIPHQPRQRIIAKARYPDLFGPRRLGPGSLYCGTNTIDGRMLDIHGSMKGWQSAQVVLK